ncbi:ATP-binding response regulator [Geomesophilobacter sediminis]|uniref:histidine kinase n=1 Tax=Geomesophilobacter sediminis TaxID=2798584 RepID=A0A8J7S7N0_9BACT|nr:response regulator [Geomesophilobacter sediminis]MBJ6727121.1 response regulator [Geomesophilobacter sediminis]
MLETIPATGTSPTILIVDDDPNNLAVISDHLADTPYTILIAEDGETGVMRAQYVRPDLILLDVMMPEMDGFETCRRLKALETTRDIPVIFMTALADTQYKVKAFEAGAVDYITKPFQREEVVARVGAHLRLWELTLRLREANETLEKRVEERTAELRDSERKLAEIIDFLPDPTFAVDLEGRITIWNRSAEEFTGVRAEDMLGKGDLAYGIAFYGSRRAALVDMVLHPSPEIEALYPYLKVENGVVTGEGYTNRVRQQNAYVMGTAAGLYDGHGRLVGAIESIRDLSERKKLEQQLRQAQKMEAIGTLAAGIAHDFNNILTAILGFSQLAIFKVGADGPGKREMERVMESSNRAADLVRQILTFSRFTEQERAPVHVLPIVEEVLKLLRSTLPSTVAIQKALQVTPAEDVIFADAIQIHQVLMNLCANSAHAMRPDGGTLEISLSRIESDAAFLSRFPELREGRYLVLTVSDTGSGIDPLLMDRIFDPYFTTKEFGEGTGMGLAVVQGIAKGHGGAISVTSEPGVGSIFHVYFPSIERAAREERPVAPKPVGGSERILLVDDEIALSELGEEMLSSLGYRVTAATSSVEALELVRSRPNDFDLLLTDLTMPGLTGVKLAAAVRTVRPDLPVLLCTGATETVGEEQAEQLGIREVLRKPYVLDALATAVRKALS